MDIEERFQRLCLVLIVSGAAVACVLTAFLIAELAAIAGRI